MFHPSTPSLATVVRLQSWWRMIRVRRKFLEVLYERRLVKRKIYRALKIYWKSERMHRVSYIITCGATYTNINRYDSLDANIWQVLPSMER